MPQPKDNFVASASFEDVLEFYVFDKELRLFVSDGLERIEIALRAQIADLLGSRNPMAHRNAQQLDGSFVKQMSKRDSSKTRHNDWIDTQDKYFDRSKEDFVKNYKSKCPNTYPPIWIAKEVGDWGLMSHFFSGMKTSDQNSIARIYCKIDPPQMESWIIELNDFRNYCAHHSRLWNRAMPHQPQLPSPGRYPIFDNIRGQAKPVRRIYAGLVVMSLMIRVLHPQSQWGARLLQLLRRAPKHPTISYQAAGFPTNWESHGFL